MARRTGTAHGREATPSSPPRPGSTRRRPYGGNRMILDQIKHIGNLVDGAVRILRSGSRPGTPLHAVDRAQIAVLIRPFIPDVDVMLQQPIDIRRALEEPQQLVGQPFEEHRLVVSSGKYWDKSKRICCPNREIVPVPVRSDFNVPSVRSCAPDPHTAWECRFGGAQEYGCGYLQVVLRSKPYAPV